MSTQSRLGTLSLLFTLLAACAVSPTGRHQLALVSEKTAIEASKESYLTQMGELRKAGKLVTDPKVTQRVNRITSRLVAQAVMKRPETKSWEWSVEVIDDPKTVNAWCMAGGRMAVYTGLLQQIDPTDDELAQVLGHEISHALANHTAERMSVAMATTAGVVLVGLVSDDAAKTMSVAAIAASLAITLPNGRAAESEADEIGIELAAKAGYNPNAAITLWQKMAKESGDGPPQFLSTHPSPGNREQRLAELAPKMMPFYKQGGTRPTYPLREAVAAR
ncbi:MAG TPA: M48 family metallopeptidase [Gammaproteobacteria bacterium]|nr:M48 family metallopeptidase [Gammaproteobacteria bacterium]